MAAKPRLVESCAETHPVDGLECERPASPAHAVHWYTEWYAGEPSRPVMWAWVDRQLDHPEVIEDAIPLGTSLVLSLPSLDSPRQRRFVADYDSRSPADFAARWLFNDEGGSV